MGLTPNLHLQPSHLEHLDKLKIKPNYGSLIGPFNLPAQPHFSTCDAGLLNSPMSVFPTKSEIFCRKSNVSWEAFSEPPGVRQYTTRRVLLVHNLNEFLGNVYDL